MLNAKRNLQWERAWVAAGLVSAMMCLPVALRAQSDSTSTDSQNQPAVTQAPAPNEAAPAAAPLPTPPQAPNSAQQQNAEENQAPPSSDAAPADQDQSSTDRPAATNLQTGLPLRTVMSPLHWGHLSLLSFQGLESYNRSGAPQMMPLGNTFTTLQALIVYSIQKSRSSLNLQYDPYVWISKDRTSKNFAANGASLTTSHAFDSRWSVTGSDNFQYSPNMANTLQSAYAADFISNTSTQTPFLNVGRKTLFNSGYVTLTTQLSASSRLTFDGMDDFVRLGAFSTPLLPTIPNVAETMNSYGGGVSLNHRLNQRTSFSVSYNYRRQSTSGFVNNSSFNSANLGVTRVLTPTLNFSLQVGPGWNNPGATVTGVPAPRQLTVQGTAELFKSFRRGGVSLSFYRNSQFSGVISNSYNNRYDVSVNRRFFTRWNLSASASFIQQQYIGRPASKGELGYGELGYMLSRNWSLFSAYRYLNLAGSPPWMGPEQMVSLGIRWAWQPETSHR